MCLLISSDSDQYSGIWIDLNNNILIGTDNYQKTTTTAYNVLCCYNKTLPSCQVHAPPAAFKFFQSGDTEKNNTTQVNNWISFTEVKFYCFQEIGNNSLNCPSPTDKNRTGSQSLQVGLVMTQTTNEAATHRNPFNTFRA